MVRAAGISADVSSIGRQSASRVASKELRTQIVLDSGGMPLKNAAANKTLADYRQQLQRYLMVKTTIHL